MSHDVLLTAIAGGIGLIVGKMFDFTKFWLASSNKETHDEIVALRVEIKELRADLDTWKEKYYSLLERVTVQNLVSVSTTTKEITQTNGHSDKPVS